ncbi:Long-chain-fatty-acid--CoA ligase [Fulvivirga imtechensis AK7]|uniref:Long-chain-fatty-acid--CoA ligase n=1 Tax=Fulvivirga imtechensis AK7 TaxID=1237149 RepID=L8JVS3_9BACT|nr:non-ribosomal peptide synthetase [Fulvivirga imtechensis]ELR72273.1 Long-chain-fatty-acid--CoA ligase [Fulvivirga imtechensis AK7]
MKQLDKKNIFDIYPLTKGQQGILFETIKNPNAGIYSIKILIGYDFLLEEEKFNNAWERILEVNEILRAIIRWRKLNRPVAVILKDAKERINIVKRESIRFQGFECYTKDHCKSNLNIEDEVFKVTLHQINANKSLIEIDSHHIVQDGWSTSILINEFIDHYQQKDATIEKAHYKKCVLNLNESIDLTSAEQFWADYLKDVEKSNLAENYDHDKLLFHEYEVSFNSEFIDLLQATAKEQRVSLATILHLGWGIAIQDYQSTDDIVFGSVVAGRPSDMRGMERVIGNFVNTLPFRLRSGSKNKLSVKEALKQIQSHISARADFELCTIGQIKKFAKIEPDTEIFDSILVIENYPFNNDTLYRDPLKAIYAEVKESSSYPLDVSIRIDEQISVNVKYQSAKFKYENVRFLISSFKGALDFIMQDTDQTITEYTAVTEGEKHKIFHLFNSPINEAILPSSSIVELFDKKVLLSSESTALVFGDATVSYRQLHKRANKLAYKLKQRGVMPGETIGVYASHSVERIISLLAILKVGGAFLPLKVAEPLVKLSEVLDNCSVSKLLIEEKFGENFYHHPSFDHKQFIDTDTSEIENDLKWKNYPSHKADIAYVLLTSGSTGMPKAVAIEHRSLQNTIHWFIDEFQVGQQTKILQLTDYTFDPSMEDIFGGLIAGAEIHLPSQEIAADAKECYKYMLEQRISLINYVPSVLYEILGNREKVESLQTVISGGEALSEAIKDELLLKGYNLYNNYGPTETTVDCLFSKCDRQRVNLGKPITNSYCLILNANNKLTPIGRTGEICIGGLGVARGYVNDPELTARKFISDPYYPGQILYKTGDYGIWQEDGTVLYQGRKDNQVKINGIRVELGHIRSVINDMSEVIQSEVITTGSPKRLVVFIIVRKEEELTEGETKERLRKILPPYMIPQTVHFLEKFPLTSNGKIDAVALEKVYIKSRPNNILSLKNFSRYESDLVKIWNEVLDPVELDINRSFFELGGDSLGLMKINNRINDHFNLDLPISTYFSYPSINLLSRHIRSLVEKENITEQEADDVSGDRVSAAKNRLSIIKRNR